MLGVFLGLMDLLRDVVREVIALDLTHRVVLPSLAGFREELLVFGLGHRILESTT